MELSLGKGVGTVIWVMAAVLPLKWRAVAIKKSFVSGLEWFIIIASEGRKHLSALSSACKAHISAIILLDFRG